MAASACPSSKRPLRRGRLLPADVYPQDPRQREDELSAASLKDGFKYDVIPPEHEHGSIKSSTLSTAVVNNCLTALLQKREEISVLQESNRKKPLFNKDQFVAVGKQPPGKPLCESFFKEISISKPAVPLPKRIPVFNKKEEAVLALYENNMAYNKATWYIKLIAAHLASQQEKNKKRQINDPTMEWTVALLNSLFGLLKKLTEFYRLSAPERNETAALVAAGLVPPPGERQNYEDLMKQWKYTMGLLNHMYSEGLLDCQEVCAWIVKEITDKLKPPAERGLLKLLVPSLLNFIPDILTSLILSRKLAGTCVKYLVGVCQPPKTAMGGGPKSPLRMIEEALECSHHSVPVRGLIGVLQLIVIQNPVACLWVPSVGEERGSQTDGSPLDILPLCPSDLPVSQSIDVLHADYKERIKKSEEEIRNRSVLVESKWQSTKTTSEKSLHVAVCLQALDALDRQSFHRQDPPDVSDKYDMDSLYTSVFSSAPRDLTSETWRNDSESLIFFLCRWSISVQRAGIHRGMLVASLLEKFQTELAVQLPALDPATPSHYVFQELLMKFLDEEGPRFDSSGKAVDPVVLESTVLLFSELISRAVFSHDAYVCALIATGLIPQVPVQPRQPAHFYNQRPAESPLPPHETNYFMQPSPASTSGSICSYDMQPPSVNYGVFAGAGGEEYLRKNAVPQSPSSYGGGYERKPMPMMSPYQIPPNHPMPQFQRPPLQPPAPHPFFVASPAPPSVEFPGMDGYEQPASVSSVLSDAPPPTLSPHYYYVLHFPVCHGRDGHSSHELNQRAILLYGSGQAREDARLTTKGVIKDTEKLFGRKFCYDLKDGRPPSRTSPFSVLRARFMQLSYFDRHVVSEAAIKVLMKRLSAVLSAAADTLPTVENIQFAMELLEKSLNIPTILESATRILEMLRPLGVNPLLTNKRGYPFIESMISPVMLLCVSLLRKYHCNLLLSPSQTVATFKILRESVLHVVNSASCTSAERCVLAYIYDLYLSAGFLKKDYEDFDRGKGSPCEQIKYAMMAKITKLATQSLPWDEDFMVDILEDPQRVVRRPPAEIVRQLMLIPNASDQEQTLALQRSFVINALLAVRDEHDLTKINNIAVFCAEMTASCNGLTVEWIMALQSMVYSKLCPASNPVNTSLQNVVRHYERNLKIFDISDRYFHERLALFCCVLIARHAIRLETLILNVVMVVLMMASKCGCGGAHLESSQLAGRLATHIMVRLLHGPEPELATVYHGHAWDRSLLISVRRGLALTPLMAILKCILVLSDSDADSSSGYPREYSQSPEMQQYRPYGFDVLKVADFARMALLDICQEESVRDCFLRGLDMLFSPDIFLDSFMKPQQTRFLVHLLTLHRQLALAHLEEPLESDKYTTCIQRILRSLDQWNVHICRVEVQLMYTCQTPDRVEKQAKNPKDKEQKDMDLLDVFAKGVIDAFQVRLEEKTTGIGSAQSKRGKTRSFVLDSGEHVWYIAPLIAKLDAKIQERVLRYIVSQFLDKDLCGWSNRSRDREKLNKSTILLGNAPFMAIVTTCLNQPDKQAEQKDNLLRKMHDQLTQFATDYRVLSVEDARYQPLLMESLSLRLSLAGSVLELIQVQTNQLTDWAFLLAQLIITGLVDPLENQDLFEVVFDFLTVLGLTILAYDQAPALASDKQDERKLYANLAKKLKKECGNKLIGGVEHVKMLLPLSRKTLNVLTVEPIGTVTDAKGNKTIPPVPFESADRKHGLQVETKECHDPWEVLEGFRNPTAFPWSFFHAVRSDRKQLTAELISHLMAWHTHTPAKTAEYFLEPPPVPAEDEVPERTPGGAEEPANSETASVDTASPRSPRGSRLPNKGKKTSTQAASKKRATRSPASVQPQFIPSSQPMPMGYGDGGGMMPNQPTPAWYGQQPTQPMPSRYGYPGQYSIPSQPSQSHPDMNRQRMQMDQARSQARPQLQSMLQQRQASSHHQQSANPHLNTLLTNHTQNQPQRTAIQQLHLQSGSNPSTGVGGGGMTSMMQPGGGSGQNPNLHPGMTYGTMRPPPPAMPSTSTGLMSEAQAQEYAMKQQQLRARQLQQHQQQQQHHFQPQGAMGYGNPMQQQTQPGSTGMGDGSQGQPMYVTDQQQNSGGLSYMTDQQQPPQTIYRQPGNMQQDYLQQQQYQRNMPRQ